MEIGQTIFLRPQGNRLRVSKKIISDVITKIGRKYVSTKSHGEFHIEGGYQKTNFTPDYKLYESREDLDTEIEKEELHSEIRKFFAGFGQTDLKIKHLREIKKIIES